MEYYAASKHYVFNEYSMTWVKSYVWCLVKIDPISETKQIFRSKTGRQHAKMLTVVIAGR